MAETLVFLMNTHDPSLPDDDRWFTIIPDKTLEEVKQNFRYWLVDKAIGEPQAVKSSWYPHCEIASVEVMKQHGMVGVYQRVQVIEEVSVP